MNERLRFDPAHAQREHEKEPASARAMGQRPICRYGSLSGGRSSSTWLARVKQMLTGKFDGSGGTVAVGNQLGCVDVV